jgi:iron complex outermembrane recepter protein
LFGGIQIGAAVMTFMGLHHVLAQEAADAQSAAAATETERTVTLEHPITDPMFVDSVQIESVTTLDLKEILRRGERTTEELLRNLTFANANGVPFSNNAVNPTLGASSVSLRGMDPADTLVLINGRRVAAYPLGAGQAFTQPLIDLYSIPLAGIEKIEIVHEGETALFGANAVAGTIDLSFRREFRGVEASVQYGNTLDKDSSEFSAALHFGVGDEKTNVSGFIDYYHRNSIFNRDRGYSAKPPFLSTNSSPYNLQLSDTVVITAGGIPATAGPLTFAHAPFFTNGFAPAADYIYTGARSSLFNFNQFSGSFPESERYGGYVSFNHKICGDEVVLYGDAFYQNVKTRNELTATATGSFQTTNQPTIAIPPNSPIPLGAEPPDTPTHLETGVPANAFNPFNPFQQIISGGTRARLAEFGNRVLRNETDAFFTTIGVKGERLFDGSWGYDAAFRYSQVKNTGTSNSVSSSRFNRILNAADPIFDPASSEFIGTTIPYNPFGDYRVPIASNAPSIGFATVHPKEVDISKLATIDFNIYTNQLFKLPAGGVAFAFGAQFRRESLSQDPDLLVQDNDVIGFGVLPFTNGNRKIFAFFSEINVPIFSAENAVPRCSRPGVQSRWPLRRLAE